MRSLDRTWITPKGEFIDVGSCKTHWDWIRERWSLFGLTEQDTKDTFNRKVFGRGWVRICKTTGDWCIELWDVLDINPEALKEVEAMSYAPDAPDVILIEDCCTGAPKCGRLETGGTFRRNWNKMIRDMRRGYGV